ncbi:MAG: 4Fe-4S binding protein [Nitrospiraceae bacterium]|nr:4Fe-4S binding protein [Nitrospiraceae bacterium]
MKNKNITKKIFSNKRYLSIAVGMALFLPPLAVIPQIAGAVNLCGAACPRMFFIIRDGGLLKGFGNNLRAEWFGASLAGAILITTFFMGRLWCSHFCPVGGATELVSRLVPGRFKIDFSFMHAPAFRYAYFFIFVAGAALGMGGISCKLCNFRVIPFLAGAPFVPAYRTYLLSPVGLAGLAAVSLTGFLARGGRAYCNLLCPVGALDSMANYAGHKLGITKKVRTEPSRCNGCGRCVGSCMVWALELDHKTIRRDQASCISCGQCIRVCPREAIRYGRS